MGVCLETPNLACISVTGVLHRLSKSLQRSTVFGGGGGGSIVIRAGFVFSLLLLFSLRIIVRSKKTVWTPVRDDNARCRLYKCYTPTRPLLGRGRWVAYMVDISIKLFQLHVEVCGFGWLHWRTCQNVSNIDICLYVGKVLYLQKMRRTRFERETPCSKCSVIRYSKLRFYRYILFMTFDQVNNHW